MSDQPPAFDSPGQDRAVRGTEREPLFEFVHEHDGTRWRCDLRDDGEGIVEARFFRDDQLVRSRSFTWQMDPTRQPRKLAIAWATEERTAIEKGVR